VEASLDNEDPADAYKISPTVYVDCPVPPLLASMFPVIATGFTA
jgi:hypothetical protein